MPFDGIVNPQKVGIPMGTSWAPFVSDTSAIASYIYILPHPSLSSELLYYAQGKAKSRMYQGVFRVKNRVKTWQIRGIWSQQNECPEG